MILNENTPKTPNEKPHYTYGMLKNAITFFNENGVDIAGKSEDEIMGAFLAVHGVKTFDEYLEKTLHADDNLKNATLNAEAANDAIANGKTVTNDNVREIVGDYMKKNGIKNVDDYIKNASGNGITR